MRSPLIYLILALLAFTNPARGQTNEELNAGLQFGFEPPGARSLALGGAFAGLADDATAAYANPAGLLWLTRSEVSAEGRHRTYTTHFPDTGSASGRPTGLGVDTLEGLRLRSLDSENNGLAFLAYAHVFGNRRNPWLSRLRLALYRHELAAFGAEIESEGPFLRNPGNGSPAEQMARRGRLSAIQGSLELNIVHYGVAAAWGLTRNLWIGAGFSYSTFDLQAVTRRFATNLPLRNGAGTLVEGVVSSASFEPADFSPENEVSRSFQDGDDHDTTFTVGLLWKAPGDRERGERIDWSLGLVYRQAPSFDLDYRFAWGAQRIALRDESGNENYVDPAVVRALSGRTQFEVPDVLAFGGMWRPPGITNQALTLTAEVTYVRYSLLEPEANAIFGSLRGDGRRNQVAAETCGEFDAFGLRFPRGAESRSEVPCISPFQGNFVLDDGVEAHFGLEYVLERRFDIAFRLGAWLDPDHQLRYDFGGRNPEEFREEDRFGIRFQEGEDEIHWTGGLGFVFQRLQLDLAFDISNRSQIFSLSSVYRWR